MKWFFLPRRSQRNLRPQPKSYFTTNGIPNGTYRDAITGDVKVVSNGTLSISGCNGQGNMLIYVLNTALTHAAGKVGEAGTYLK